jgi:ribosomal protein L40E
MPSNRHNLVLDEHAFQGLLFAAYTVQEYNDRLNNERVNRDQLSNDHANNDRPNGDRPSGNRPKQARQPLAESEGHAAPEPSFVCRYCGAPRAAEESRCENCGRDELRPGERLQRNWASMWLMSQDQDLWSRRSPETGEGAQKDFPPPPAAEPRPLPSSARDKSVPGKSAVAAPSFETPAFDPPSFDARSFAEPAFGEPAFDKPILDKAAFRRPALDDQSPGDPASDAQTLELAESENKFSTTAIDETIDTTDHWTGDGLTPQDSALPVHTFQLSDSLPIETSADESADLTLDAADVTVSGNGSLMQNFAHLRATLRLHRSDLYLGGAVLVAALALLWPAAGSPQRAALSPWERALVTLGLADAPEPAVHVQGDPAIEVWVDPHTALYYCPGEDQYGKTADGRLSSQREAQMDRFEPAGRLACE